MGLTTVPAHQVSLAQLATLLNAGYQDYAVPVAFDAAALARRIVVEHIDLGASHVLQHDGAPCGVMLVARRGGVSRLAALGLTPARRGMGLGRQAVALAQAEAQARGDVRLQLEVITTNLAAQRVYAASGFTVTRQLVGYQCAPQTPTGPDSPYELCGVHHAMPVLAASLPADLPWQIAPAALWGEAAPVRGWRRRDNLAAALFDASGASPRLLSFAVAPQLRRQGVGRGLIEALMQAHPGPWRIAAQVPDELAEAFLAATGWQRGALAQFEMEWQC